MILSFWFAKGAFGYLIQPQSTRLLGPPFTSQFVIPSKARNPLFASDATNAWPALYLKQLVIPSKARNRCSPATPRTLGPPIPSNNLSFRAKRGIRCSPATPRNARPAHSLQQFVIPSKARNPLFASDATNARPAPQTTCHSEQSEESAVRQRRHERSAALYLKQLVIPSKARNPLFASDATNARPAPQTICHSEQSEESALCWRRHRRSACCPSNNLSFRAKRVIRCSPAPRTLALHLVQTLAPLNRQLRSSPPPVFNNLAPPNPPFRRLTPRFPRSLPSAWLSRSSTIRSLC